MKYDFPEGSVFRVDGMAAFHLRFPKIAAREARCVTVIDRKSALPPGRFAFLEFYCNDPACDCRRVMLAVTSTDWQSDPLAVITFGWEKREFYEQWCGNDPEGIDYAHGAHLELMATQSLHADAFLDYFKASLARDSHWIERVKRHYARFKQSLG